MAVEQPAAQLYGPHREIVAFHKPVVRVLAECNLGTSGVDDDTAELVRLGVAA
jgi:hypothetical protein